MNNDLKLILSSPLALCLYFVILCGALTPLNYWLLEDIYSEFAIITFMALLSSALELIGLAMIIGCCHYILTRKKEDAEASSLIWTECRYRNYWRNVSSYLYYHPIFSDFTHRIPYLLLDPLVDLIDLLLLRDKAGCYECHCLRPLYNSYIYTHLFHLRIPSRLYTRKTATRSRHRERIIQLFEDVNIN